MWGVVEAKACKVPHNSVERLKVSIVKTMKALPREQVARAATAFRRRVQAVVDKEDKHIE